MVEKVVLVDSQDNEIGEEKKLKAHQEGLLHRAFSVYVFNEKNEMLLQKRSCFKYHAGGLWSNVCCGHPRPGEQLDFAVHRRLQEEIGFDCELQKVFVCVYKQNLGGNLCEHEFGHVYAGFCDKDKTEIALNYNKEEIEDVKWVSWYFLVVDVQKKPNLYAPWFRRFIYNANKEEKEDVRWVAWDFLDKNIILYSTWFKRLNFYHKKEFEESQINL